MKVQMKKRSPLDLLNRPMHFSKLLDAFNVKPHPVIKAPSRERLLQIRELKGDEIVQQLLAEIAKAQANERDEPFWFGWEPEQWRDADELLKISDDILISGSNRSGKSCYAAKRVVQKMYEKPDSIILCFSTSESTSIRDQQKLIWYYLPREWKYARRNNITKIGYKRATGFSDAKLVAPNGSECYFMFYTQDGLDIEGGQVDLWWADEIIPLDWVVTLRGRTVDRRGKGLVTFTPIHGWNQTTSEYVSGSRVLKWQICEDVPQQKLWPGGQAGRIPYILECFRPRHHAIFFHARHNPYIDYSDLRSKWITHSTDQILIRLYGITRKTGGAALAKFGKHNIIPHDKIPAHGTNFFFVDFAWNRNWAMLWFRVCQIGDKPRIFVYREWPDQQNFGEWVLPSEKPDGARGPAQQSLGYGIDDYKRLVLGLESPTTDSTGNAQSAPRSGTGEPYERIFIRYGDPRSGNTGRITEEGGTTVIEMLAEGENPLFIEPVAGREGNSLIKERVIALEKWLAWDDAKPLCAVQNEPMLYVSDKCQNCIDSIKIWTGEDGQKGASKDFVDLLGYAAMMEIEQSVGNQVIAKGASY